MVSYVKNIISYLLLDKKLFLKDLEQAFLREIIPNSLGTNKLKHLRF